MIQAFLNSFQSEILASCVGIFPIQVSSSV